MIVTKQLMVKFLSFVLSAIPEKIMNHNNLELLPLKKITEIKNSFNINEVEYRKSISLSFETDCYITDIIYVLSFIILL